MRARFGLLQLGALLAGALIARAQGVPPSGDPARRLTSSLAAQTRSILEQRSTPLRTLLVPPVIDRTASLGTAAQRIRALLLLDLAALQTVRIQRVDVPARSIQPVAPGAAVLETWLDATRDAVTLTGSIVEPGSSSIGLTVLAAIPANTEDLASLERPSGGGGRVRCTFVPAGRVTGPVYAAASGSRNGTASEALVVVTESSTRVLALEGASFREVASVPHPRSEIVAPVARDARAGVAFITRDLGAPEVWVRPPNGAPSYRWLLGAASPSQLKRNADVPLGSGVGGVLVGSLEPGTNQITQLGWSSGPADTPRAIRSVIPPLLEAATTGRWLVTEAVDGSVRVLSPRETGEPNEVGQFGSAIAALPASDDAVIDVLGDQQDGRELVISRVSGSTNQEVWRGRVPFSLCLLAPGDFDGDAQREAVAVGCGQEPELAVVRVEDER